jgi:hypothetical protein
LEFRRTIEEDSEGRAAGTHEHERRPEGEQQEMDLQLYYQKIREFASTIQEEFPVVLSRETADGGKNGVLSEVAVRLAAKMVVEGTARLATPEEADAFRQAQAEAKRIADSEAAAAKVQLTVLSTDELKRLRGAGRSKD